MDRNWWLPTLSPTKDAMLPQALPPPACLLGSQGGLRSKSPPPLLWALFLIHTSLPRGTRQHQAHGAVTDSMFELQVCALAESTRELLLLLAQSRHRGLHGWVEGKRSELQTFPQCVHSTRGSNLQLGRHTLLSPLLPYPAPWFRLPGLTSTPGRLSFLHSAPKISFALGKKDASEAVGTQQLRPSTQKDIQWRLSHANSLSLWTALCTSIKVNKP